MPHFQNNFGRKGWNGCALIVLALIKTPVKDFFSECSTIKLGDKEWLNKEKAQQIRNECQPIMNMIKIMIY